MSWAPALGTWGAARSGKTLNFLTDLKRNFGGLTRPHFVQETSYCGNMHAAKPKARRAFSPVISRFLTTGTTPLLQILDFLCRKMNFSERA